MDNPGQICRFCLFEDTDCEERPLIDLFKKPKCEDVLEKIQNSLNLKLSPNDKIPPIICQSCMEKVNYFSDFQELCAKSEKQLERLYGLEKSFSNTSQDTDQNAPSVNWISDERMRTACRTESDFSINYKSIKKQGTHHSKLSGKKLLTIHREKSKVLLRAQKRKSKVKLEIKNSRNVFCFKCKYCKKKFTNIHDHQRHIRLVHKADTIYKCGKCDKIFLDQQKCLDHEEKHKVQCKICNFQVLAKNMGLHLHKHVEKFRTKPAVIFKSPALPKLSNKQIICKICRKIFKTENRLTVHMKKVHEMRKIRFSANRKHRSDKLKLRIRLKRLMKAQSYRCRFCNKQFAALKELHGHMTTHADNKKKCPKCGKEFLYKKHFNKHVLQCFCAPTRGSLQRSSSLPTIPNQLGAD